MADPITRCPLWGDEYEATGFYFPETRAIRVDHSPRAGGAYKISGLVQARLSDTLSNPQKSRLTTWLIDQRSQGVEIPQITEEAIARAKDSRPLPAHECADRLLRFVSNETEKAGAYVDFSSTADGSKPRTDTACAHSESIDWSGVFFYLNYLQEKGWVQRLPLGHDSRFTCRVTVDGYSRIEEQRTTVDSSQAFVAMWFHETMDEVYDKGIKPGIEAAGLQASKNQSKGTHE